MNRIISWAALFAFFGRYLMSRCKLAPPPLVDDIIEHVTVAIGPLVGVPKYFHLVGAEHVPESGPMVVCGNHSKLDDPLLVYHAGRMASPGKALHLRVMMRDNYFVGPLFENPVIQAVELFKCLGAYPINRDKPSLSQMKCFVDLLSDGEGFIIFPGRTRTRSGHFIEYRDEFVEPGGVSWFIHRAQRRLKDVPVPAVPIVRNYNPVSKRTALIFGPPLFLESDATREGLREFDHQIVYAMSALVEISCAHIVSGLIYLHALHGRAIEIQVSELVKWVEIVTGDLEHVHLCPELVANPQQSTAQTIRYLAKHEMLHISMDTIVLRPEAILSLPPLDTRYRRANPVKYLVNQTVHLGEFVAACERVTLERVY